MNTANTFVSVREASRLMNVTIGFVYSLVWAGKLKASKTEEGHWRIPLTAINERLGS